MFCTKYSVWYVENLVAERLLVHFLLMCASVKLHLIYSWISKIRIRPLLLISVGAGLGLTCSCAHYIPQYQVSQLWFIEFSLIWYMQASRLDHITILRRAFQFEKFMKRVTLLLTFNDTCGIGKRSEWNGIASLFQNVCSIIQQMTNSILNNIVLVAVQVFVGLLFFPRCNLSFHM